MPRPVSTIATVALMVISGLCWSPRLGAAAADREHLTPDARDAADVVEHRSFDPGPELQRTPGGSLIVNAFIMDGPVRVEIRDRESDELLYQKEAASMFPFEVPRTDLKVEPEQTVVRIFVRGHLSHELEVRPGGAEPR